jgi:hypothetical protein
VGQILLNNVSAIITGTVTTGQTAIGVWQGKGALFEGGGALSTTNYLRAAMFKMNGDKVVGHEIVYVVGRSTDTLTIQRAKEGSTALSYNPGDVIEVVLTAESTACLNRAQTWTQTQTIQRSDVAPVLSIVGDGQQPTVKLTRYSSNTAQSYQIFQKARGSLASPAAVSGGDAIGGFMQQAYDGGTWRTLVEIRGSVESYTGSDDLSGVLDINTRPSGAAGVLTNRMRVKGDGSVGIGTTSPSTTLHVNGPIRCGSYTVATVPSAATVGAGTQIYVSNESGGGVPAFSDGINWRRVTDRAVIS